MGKKLKVYLAHSISTRGEFEDSKKTANKLRELGYDVYIASENTKINDKTNNPTPKDIYNGDVSEILNCDIFVVNLSGGTQDGTISEIGVVAGLNEANIKLLSVEPDLSTNIIPIIAYTTNARLLEPQLYQGISSASANHLVLGMIDRWGGWYGSESNMLEGLKNYIDGNY